MMIVPREQTVSELKEALSYHHAAADGIRLALRALAGIAGQGNRRKRSPEERAKMSEAMKATWARRRAQAAAKNA